MSFQKIQTIPLPDNKRYYNDHINKVRALLGLQKLGVSVHVPIPAQDGKAAGTTEPVPLLDDRLRI